MELMAAPITASLALAIGVIILAIALSDIDSWERADLFGGTSKKAFTSESEWIVRRFLLRDHPRFAWLQRAMNENFGLRSDEIALAVTDRLLLLPDVPRPERLQNLKRRLLRHLAHPVETEKNGPDQNLSIQQMAEKEWDNVETIDDLDMGTIDHA